MSPPAGVLFDASKPAPDLVAVALERSGLRAEDAVFVGDTRWDVEAAAAAGVRCVAVETGGWAPQELRDAGAVAVFRDAAAIVEEFETTPIGELARRISSRPTAAEAR